VQGMAVRPTGPTPAPPTRLTSSLRSIGWVWASVKGDFVSVSSAVRRLTAVTAVTAAAVGAVALPAAAADHRSSYPRHAAVYISGVQADSPGWDDRSNRSLNREWVDITNSTRRAVNLSGWTLSDEDGHTYTFRNVWLDGRSTVRVHTGIGRDVESDVYQDRQAYVWDNDSDTATLRNDHGRFIDAVSWGRLDRDHRGGHHHWHAN
jgi:hypothetical protein